MRQVFLLLVTVITLGVAFARPGTITQASHSTFTVNSTGDAADASAGDGTCETVTASECTLRAAIEEANTHPILASLLAPSLASQVGKATLRGSA